MHAVVGETGFTAGLRAYMCAPPPPSIYTFVCKCIQPTPTHTHTVKSNIDLYI